jgi:DNA polymerase I-like protein with 3'-5' exonuclease and polymerase domains
MSDQGLAERLHTDLAGAKQIKETFYRGFTGLKAFTEASQEMARTLGYVTTACGRRRHLPNAQLEDYSFESLNSDAVEFNPLLGISTTKIDSQTKQLIENYKTRLAGTKYYKDVQAIKDEALTNNIKITSNRSLINHSLRQCINTRAQGTAAEMMKLAMINVSKDPIMRELGFQLLVTVHDEMFGQCPRENAERAAERLSELMNETAYSLCPNVPWKCDGYHLSR